MTFALALALAGTVHAGEPMVGHLPAAGSQLTYKCDAKNSQEPTLLTDDMGCHLMRLALTDPGLGQADRTTLFLSGARLRQQELMMAELREIRALLVKLEGTK